MKQCKWVWRESDKLAFWERIKYCSQFVLYCKNNYIKQYEEGSGLRAAVTFCRPLLAQYRRSSNLHLMSCCCGSRLTEEDHAAGHWRPTQTNLLLILVVERKNSPQPWRIGMDGRSVSSLAELARPDDDDDEVSIMIFKIYFVQVWIPFPWVVFSWGCRLNDDIKIKSY